MSMSKFPHPHFDSKKIRLHSGLQQLRSRTFLLCDGQAQQPTEKAQICAFRSSSHQGTQLKSSCNCMTLRLTSDITL